MADKPVDEGLGKRIEWLRNAAGLSSREVDALAGLQACHTRSVVTGTIANPRVHTLKKIGAVFGAANWLVTGEGGRPSKAAIVAAVTRARKRSAVDNRGATD